MANSSSRSYALALCALLALSLLLSHASGASDRLVERPLKLPGEVRNDVPIVDPPHRIAGYFKLDREVANDAHMFYFFFESRARGQDVPVVLWMTGGPGCSSEIAVLYENGPFSMNKTALTENPYGWDAAAHMIYVDQPINTGFSWSDDPADDVSGEHQVAEDMLDFLQEFFEAHPELADRDFYVTGESYAGHYVPAVANRVYRARELGEGRPIKLAGAAIGNGLTVPAVQYGAYADYALQEGVISQGTRDSIQWWYPACRWSINLCESYRWRWLCGLSMTWCQLSVFGRILGSAPGINVYDIRKQCIGPLCYDFSDADAYLNSAAVKEALGVPETREWSECNMLVNRQFAGDFMRSFSAKLVPLLEDGIRVLIYAGDRDLICNWLGNRRWVDALEWRGAEGWAAAGDEAWRLRDGSHVGNVTAHDTLTFAKVFQAGHMVPMDQPAAALDLVRRFVNGESLAGRSKRGGESEERKEGLAVEQRRGEAAAVAAS